MRSWRDWSWADGNFWDSGVQPQVGGLLTLDESCACAETRARAARKLALIEQKMADLVVMQQLLGELVQQCDAGDGGTICPIIEALIRE